MKDLIICVDLKADSYNYSERRWVTIEAAKEIIKSLTEQMEKHERSRV